MTDQSDEELVMRLLRESGFQRVTIDALTYTQWKDGIDIDRPLTPLMRFVRSVAAMAPAFSSDRRKQD